MEAEKDRKDLSEQHAKAEKLFSKLSVAEQAFIQPLLLLQVSRNSLYLQFVTSLKQLEKHYEGQYSLLDSQRRELLKNFKGFWLRALKNNSLCSSLVYEKDEKVLEFITDIQCITEDNSDNFTLDFFFSENPYISNEVLSKKYIMTNEDVMEQSIGTKIIWKDAEPEHEKGSFFKFFNNVTMPTPSDFEGMNESMEQELVDSVEQDFDIASEFKDEIIPKAVLFYFDTQCDPDLPSS